MRTAIVIGALCLSGIVSFTTSVAGDTRAPSTQTIVIQCGGATVTLVSPTFRALAAQVVGTTGVGILQYAALSDGTVIYQHPSFQALNPSALTTCTAPLPDGSITLAVLMTPQGR